MDQHCPDFVLTIQPEHKVTFYDNFVEILICETCLSCWKQDLSFIQAVVLTILGTRIFPRPHPQVKLTFWVLLDCSHLHVIHIIIHIISTASSSGQTKFLGFLLECSHLHVISGLAGPDHGLGCPDKRVSWWFCTQVSKFALDSGTTSKEEEKLFKLALFVWGEGGGWPLPGCYGPFLQRNNACLKWFIFLRMSSLSCLDVLFDFLTQSLFQWDGRWLPQFGTGSSSNNPGSVADPQRILSSHCWLLTWRWPCPAVHQVYCQEIGQQYF